MQISTTISLLTLTAIAAASSTFSLLSIRSGSRYQYSTISAADGSLVVVSADAVQFELKDDNSLYDLTNKKYITLSNGAYVESDTADKGFSLQNGYLTHGSDSFYACPDGKTTKLTSSCSDSAGSPIGLSARSISGGSSSVSTTSTTAAHSTTASHTTTATTHATSAAASTTPQFTGNVQFGVIATHSGTQFQFAAINKVPAHLHVFSVGGTEGTAVTLTLHADGTLTDQDGVGINWDSKTGELGDVSPWGDEKPTKGFSIKDGHLVLDGKDNWKACPSGDNKFSLANNDCTGGTGIGLYVVNEKNV